MFLNLMSWTPPARDATRTLWAAASVMTVAISEHANSAMAPTSTLLFTVRVSEALIATAHQTTQVMR